MAKAEATVDELVSMIQRGELRLPEMQRRYVWRSTRVRDLMDLLIAATHRAQSWSGTPMKACPCRNSLLRRRSTLIKARGCCLMASSVSHPCPGHPRRARHGAREKAKLKRGGEQTVRVEHVHVYSGGQAIVGAVSTQRAEGGVADERGRQADGATDARALAFAPGAALFGEDASRDTLPEGRVDGQKRCRMHGGGKGSGAPPGERNSNYRHGLRTREAIAERRALRALIRDFRGAL